MKHALAVIALVAALVGPDLARAQSSPYLPDGVYRHLVNEISGDIAFEHMRWFTHHHRPMGGSEGFEAVARYVEQKAREYGLEDVQYIKLKSESPSWTARLGELWLTEPERRRLAFTPEVALSLADLSRPTDIASAELVDVGEGMRDADYEGREVKGKVVVASGPLGAVMRRAVWDRGALGIVYFTTGRTDFPDQVPWTRIPAQNEDKTKDGTFAFVLSQREGLRLRRQLQAAKDVPFKVSVKVASEFHTPSQAIVEAVIRGTEIHDQDLVLTGHLQEERFSANDDASGCASVLEIARALKRMIDDGRLPRPTRDIRFWWVDEISAEEQYFADRPEERKQFLANINQDMVGAKQSVGSRVQFVTRPPASRASFLGEVVESVVESLVQGNTAYLAALMNRSSAAAGGGAAALEDQPFTRPVLSRLGTRERYDARVIPFHNSTDHQVFNQATIGIPAVTFTNWPDDYIHSTDDDLWQMDATQLKRNAVAVAASTWFLASAGEPELRQLATNMAGAAYARLGREFARALQILSAASPEDQGAAWGRALTLVREGAAREQRAVRSLARMTGGATPPWLAAAIAQTPTPDLMEAQLTVTWKAVSGQAPAAALSAREEELARKVPSLVDDPAGYLEKRRKVQQPPGLHGLMAYETLNFVDGTRSHLDVYRAVAAEAESAGAWYYGAVSLDQVTALLDSAEKAGIITVTTRPADAPPAKQRGRP